jgi:RNA polymerase sigma factor (sigma-70 family)
MPPSPQNPDSVSPGVGQFTETHWSIVLAAGRSDSTEARAALETLCRAYWFPLYSFVRRQGHNAHDAQDLTQAFFARLLGKHALGAVDHTKGKFRSFLLASLKNFLADESDKARALKRGGGQVFVSIDADSAEARYGHEPAHDVTAERIFERQWALALLEQVLARLQGEYAAEGKSRLFDQLKTTLTEGKNSRPYASIAAQLGMSADAVKMSAHRIRRRYRELLRAEVAHTVAVPDEIDDEIRHLFAALSR